MQNINIYWSRRDFRLNDNPALNECLGSCAKNEAAFLPLFVLENYMYDGCTTFQFGYPQRVFLSRALPKFAANFENFLLIKGRAAESIIDLSKLILKNGASVKVYVNEDVYVDFYKQLDKIKKAGIDIVMLPDQLTVSRNTRSGAGSMYSVFTPFKKAVWHEFLTTKVLTRPNLKNINYIQSDLLEKLKNSFELIDVKEGDVMPSFSKNRQFKVRDYKSKVEHTLDIEELIKEEVSFEPWYCDEEGAIKALDDFVRRNLVEYKNKRDSLEIDATSGDGTSKMSLALTWGLISARYIRNEIQSSFDYDFVDINWLNLNPEHEGAVQYLSELVWREFYKYLLYHDESLMHTEYQEKFRYKVEWVEEAQALIRFKAWIKGETGYKVVDAAMAQLARTGWMHNRSRMIVASVLTKNLGVDWRWGQEYFRAALIDLDEASNNGGWQWGASVGADPKPIRIFNPYLQADNYDKTGAYQVKWLGEDVYNTEERVIVEHKEARSEALRRYGLNKGGQAKDC